MFRQFSWKGANYRIASDRYEIITERIRSLRLELEEYIGTDPDFKTSLTPVQMPEHSIPEIAARMIMAGQAADVGPMAAVAGTIAQMAAETGIEEGAAEAVVENGGDLFISAVERDSPFYIGLYPSSASKLTNLAFQVPPSLLPLAVCSSSSTMGHSFSLGECDLATVFSADASLADAAATSACNSVRSASDIEPVLSRTLAIEGVTGLMIVIDEEVGMAGDVPELVRHRDPDVTSKVTRNRFSNFPD